MISKIEKREWKNINKFNAHRDEEVWKEEDG